MSARLTLENARTIRRMAEEGKPVKEIARLFDVGWETVRRVLRKESWKEPEGEAK